MSNSKYPACEALDPCFEIMMKGLSKYVDGEHYFDTLADDVVFEFLYEFPGWPRVLRGRKNLIALYSGYGRNIRLDRGASLLVHPSDNGRVVTLEYEVEEYSSTMLPTTIGSCRSQRSGIARSCAGEMDSLAAWTAMNKPTL